MAVKEAWRGRFFEDFEVGDVYEHPLGRMISTTDNFWFTLISQNTAPMLFLFHESQDHHRSLLPERDHTQVEHLVVAVPLLRRKGVQGDRRYVHQGIAVGFQLGLRFLCGF
jgi:hypothetical protein